MAGEVEFQLRSKTYVGLGVAGSVVLTPDPTRIGLWLQSAGGVINGTLSVVLPDGSVINFTLGTTSVFTILYKDWGPLPACGVIEGTSGVNGKVTVLEMLHQRE